MDKKEFEFYQDVKVTVWARQKFTIEAESKEEALNMVEKFKKEDIGTSGDSHLIWDTEWMTETWEDIPVEENGGCATIELYDAQTKEMIGDNALSEELSAMKKPRKVLGYQIHDDNGEFPEGLFSFMVFKTRSDAESYMLVEDLKGFDIHEYYKGDIENPSVIEYRIFKKGERVFNYESGPNEEDLCGWATVCEDTHSMYTDQIVLLKMDDGSENESEADGIYQMAEGKTCPKCGGPLCLEHMEGIGYPYYCPECDENFYDCEVQ